MCLKSFLFHILLQYYIQILRNLIPVILYKQKYYDISKKEQKKHQL
jgi:hypothetical protein